jgi:hypothetical protein
VPTTVLIPNKPAEERWKLNNVCVNNKATLQSNQMSTDLPKLLVD